MHLKQRFLAVLVLVGVTLAMLAVSKSEITGSGTGETGLSVFRKKETIYFWYADESLSGYFNSAAVAFGEQHNVRVIPVLASESEYLEAINRACVQEEDIHHAQAPDVYMLSNDSLEKAYLSGLASVIQDEAGVCDAKHFPKAALDAVTYQEKKVAYPLTFETSVLLYNATYQKEWANQQADKEIDLRSVSETESEEELPEAMAARADMTKEELVTYYLEHSMPVTVDDILNIGDTFDVPQGVDGIMKWDVSDIFYNYWFVGNYMTVGTDTGDVKGAIDINNAEAVACLEVYKKLNQFFSIESDTVSFDSVVQEFIDGKIVFTIATTDVLARLEEARENGTLAYEIGIARLPDVSSELKSRSLSVTGVLAVNGYSQKKELANAFASFLVNDYADQLYERSGKVAANLQAKAGHEMIDIFLQEYADSISLPKMMSTSNFWIQLEVLFAKVWNGEDAAALVAQLQNQMLTQTVE